MKTYLLVYRPEKEPLVIHAYTTKEAAITAFYASLGQTFITTYQIDKDDAIDYMKSIKYVNLEDNIPYYYSDEEELYIEEIDIEEAYKP